jgi:hypothetical protein
MFTDTELRDPTPPVPGAGERAAVANRAKQIKRNRRLTAAGGALGVVAVLSLGVVALAGGGSSNPSTTQVQVAGTSVTRDAAPSTTLAPAPEVATTVPAPAPAVEAPSVPDTPAPAVVPATFTVSGVVPGVPAGVSATVRLAGDGGTFTTTASADGSFSLSGVPAGHYDADYSWTSTDGASQAGRVVGGVDVNGDLTISFS